MKNHPFARGFLASLLLGLPALALQTDNHGVHAVPTPGPVVIDGALGDWDLSGQTLMCYDVATLKDVHSARVAMMHDAENLYVAVQWKDPTPMANSHDPQFQADKGWAGDSVQLRFKTDRISHLTTWYFPGRKEPCIHIDYGKSLTEPFGGGSRTLAHTTDGKLADGAEMAFKADADGKGYVQEIKMPWALITLGGRAALGDRFACGFELLWGDADWPVHRYADNLVEGQTSREFFWSAHTAWGPVWLEPKGKLTLPIPAWERIAEGEKPEGPVKIAYTLDKDSRVTLAIDDAQGRRVRNLLAAAARKAGANTDLWDGLDDVGRVTPPGRYTVKGLAHDGLHLRYLGRFASPGNPPWSTADGKGAYYGDHTPPEAVVFGPGDRGALACPMGEAGQHLIGIDLDGRRQWGLANRVAFGGGRIGLATDGTTLWVANADTRSGAFTIWRCELASGTYAPWARKDKDGKDVLDLPICDTNGLAQCRTIALHSNRLAVVMALDRAILLLDARTGETQGRLADLPEGLAACAFRGDGKLLVAAGGDLLVVDPENGARTHLAGGLDDPQGLAVDAQGRIYVSQRGAAMNVAVFDTAGKRLAAIGKAGGRPAVGLFDPAGMLNPAQIALDPRGRLWVTEVHQQPKRTSVWQPDPSAGSAGSPQGGSGQTATLAFDLVGTTAYSAGGSINPFDPMRGFSESVEYGLDFAAQKFRPLASLPDALGTGGEWVTRYAHVDGREYVQMRGTARNAGMVKLYLRLPDGAWRHVAEWGNAGLGSSLDEPRHKEWNRTYATPLWEGLFGKGFLWVDQNDDGRAERAEIQTMDRQLGRCYWGQAMGEDLTVAIPAAGSSELLVFRPQGFTPGGTPRYTPDRPTVLAPPIELAGGGMVMVGRDGRVYVNDTPLHALDPSGNVLWTYPNNYLSVHGSHRAPAPRPGLLIGPGSIYGAANVGGAIGEVFYLNGNLGQNFLFTEDGLWVQSIFNDCRGWYDVPAEAVPGMPCDAMTAGGESFGGWFCKGADGRFYVCGGGTAAVVYELTGLETLRRFGASVEVTAADVTAADELRVRRAAVALRPKRCAIRAVAAPPALDGSLAAWQMDRDSVEIAGVDGKVGRAKALHDDANLYLAWEVRDSSPLRNAGQNEKLLFITGDCVDLMLRTGEGGGDKPAAGDLRLVLAMQHGQPVATLFQPIVAGAPAVEAADLGSPWRTVHFDRVRRVEIPLAMKPAPGGYTVTAAMPLSLLGNPPLKGRTLRGDFGILLSDSAGQETTSRNYWSNPAANNTSDVPDEAMLLPALWGELVVE